MKSFFHLLTLLFLSFTATSCVQTSTRDSNNTGGLDLHKSSHAEEPYLSMTRTVQLLNMLEIRGWSIAHIKSGDYEVYIQYDGKWELLDGRSIDKSSAEYLFLEYAREGDDIALYSLTNTGSAAAKIKSHFTSAGRYRTDPIPAANGTYTLVETYDKKGKIVIKLSGIMTPTDN